MVVHGLAATIRSVEESETFDLAGQNGTTISSTVLDAFREPFVTSDLTKMVRITLVIGAGKQARQKYDDNALKYVTAALQQCGYVEDRAASCIPECAGAYKSQHDTAKNLKTIVIFPKIIQQQNDQSSTNNNTTSTAPPLIPIDSPDYKIAVSSLPIFSNMLKSKCPSWIQKKGCLQCIEELKAIVEKLDTKLITGNGLNDSEQAFYDVVTVLDAKEKLVRDEMQKHVENSTITVYEKQILLQQNAEKIAELKRENKAIAKAQQRKELLEKIIPQQSPHPLRFDTEIRKLQKELLPLLKFYEQNKGKLLSIQDSHKITRKEEIDNEITDLEESSRGWFEDEHEYQSKIQASRAVLIAATKANNNNKKASPQSYAAAISSSSSSSKPNTATGTKWVLPGETGKFATSKSSTKKNKNNKGSLFSAMMMDDDSDDDDEDDDDYYDQQKTATATTNSNKKKPTASPTSKDGFTEVVGQKPKSNKPQPTSTKSTTSKQTIFGKANIDSDSDDDDDDDDNDHNNKPTESGAQQDSGEAATTTKSKKKKNKKKNKNKAYDEGNGKDSADALNEAYQKAKQREIKILEEKKKEHENEHVAISFLRVLVTIIIEILMAITTWFIATVFGKSKNATSVNKKRK